VREPQRNQSSKGDNLNKYGVLWLLFGNHNEIMQLKEKALKYKAFTGYRALTTRKQATK
jgi:hypothetical protein